MPGRVERETPWDAQSRRLRNMAIVEVAAALIRDDAGRYLIAQRAPGSHLAGLWEFPGGKRHAGETLEQCLRRELAEELGASFVVGERITTVHWDYPEKTVALHFYRCRLESGTIAAHAAQALVWVEPARLGDYELPPPDRALVERLQAEG